MSLIVLEGLDGSGKGTQTKRLYESVEKKGPVRRLSFPNYASPSSALVKMYLQGDFGSRPEDVNAYAASAFYAVDRYASYQMDWRRDYEAGVLLLADRYATSNLVYQLAKLPREEWPGYLRWAEDFEYEKLGIPRPEHAVEGRAARRSSPAFQTAPWSVLGFKGNVPAPRAPAASRSQ